MTPIADARLQVCRTCPLFKEQWDGNHRCRSDMYMDPITKKTSYLPKKGFVNGCGCVLEKKIYSPNAKCVAGLWTE